MKVTYYGHSCFGVDIEGSNILFDPFIRPNALAAHVDVAGLRPDFILISHGHWDHLADVAEIAKNSDAMLVANFEIGSWFAGQGIKNIHQMNIGGKKAFDWGIVKMTHAIHSSGLPDNSYGGTAGGFVIESPVGNFYYSGDTALTMDMEITGRQHKLDFAVLPIGDNFTMDIEDAIAAADMVKCEKVFGVHYDTFPSIQIDKKAAKAQFALAGKDLFLAMPGETIELNTPSLKIVH